MKDEYTKTRYDLADSEAGIKKKAKAAGHKGELLDRILRMKRNRDRRQPVIPANVPTDDLDGIL